ncbi:HEAT repeat domain-containing protein [Pseudobacteriovorax antillogorgiicola]|uniref:Uncharacterized protein n=1 Tax=Pseudobacteriovorax antillogorgiicola TaxID=1513793 RepID=A0A1Y6BX76_9BACT|nr:HEAT repeat domain-containing protein [Pseudobacteriovorax antillogorgiicola]TCS50271.1 hypothetical protein EDD56_11389 [Pseudobacteriovorax antillogorgiicola]SMF33486.1 hypothetical protein SAMN06296036_11088 [Pseudobacteriovorax antillogorgiicola]
MTNKMLQEYINQPSSRARIKKLEMMREEDLWLPISLANDLMCLRLGDAEKTAIIRSTSSKNNLAFEDFLTRNVSNWNQNIASCGLWEWAIRSDGILWHRSIPLSHDPHLSQRVSYTLLDLAWYGAGAKVVENFIGWEGLEEMSPAFLSLMFYRSLQWNVESERFKKIALNSLKKVYGVNAPPERTIPYYLAYLYRYDFNATKKLQHEHSISGIWTQFHGSVCDEIESGKRLNCLHEISQKKSTKASEAQLLKYWPMIWERHQIEVDALCWIFAELAGGRLKTLGEQSWEIFSGIPSDNLLKSLKACKTSDQFLAAIRIIGNLIHVSQRDELLDCIREFVTKAENPADFIGSLPQRFSTGLNTSSKGTSTFDRILDEQAQTLKNAHNVLFTEVYDAYTEKTEDDRDAVPRQAFFNLAYRNLKPKKIPKENEYWAELIAAWQDPKVDKLDHLSQLARQSPSLYQICFIDTLSRFKGIDNAALKLLDYIRSQEEDVLRAIIHALSGINTNRSIQELVAFLTRPNVSFHLQMEITQVLQEADLALLQSELRSAINDLKYDGTGDNPVWELREAISSLLLIEEPEEPKTDESSTSSADLPTTEKLDHHLQTKLKDYGLLSGEAKRALRTAQFFHLQVETSGNLKTIDLSPAIDMQYKALELSFREKFEDSTGNLIRQGILQRKLDVIGYARPIPRAMDEFEHYIESLPIINTIPFFSRFKLRKMLRAICQFRPGRRFTLDGLKAFALFFICFSRKECRYGLNNLFPLPSMTDEELFDFCKSLHVFQDFRNRAAHEGFHPDASNDLAGIWEDTAKIVENMIRVQKIIAGSTELASYQTGA